MPDALQIIHMNSAPSLRIGTMTLIFNKPYRYVNKSTRQMNATHT